jgi:hypothetical protein
VGLGSFASVSLYAVNLAQTHSPSSWIYTERCLSGIRVKHYREEVAGGRLPARERYGERLIWDKRVLDHHVNKDN